MNERSSYQYWLARLYTSQKFRNEFFKDKTTTLSFINADPEIKDQLSKLNQEEIEFFASGLINKRYGVVKSFFPESSKVLSADFRKYFEVYASDTPISGMHLKHLHDALDFGRFFLSNFPWQEDQIWMKEVLNREFFFAKTFLPGNLFLIGSYNLRVDNKKSHRVIEIFVKIGRRKIRKSFNL